VTQNPVLVTECRFDPDRPHQINPVKKFEPGSALLDWGRPAIQVCPELRPLPPDHILARPASATPADAARLAAAAAPTYCKANRDRVPQTAAKGSAEANCPVAMTLAQPMLDTDFQLERRSLPLQKVRRREDMLTFALVDAPATAASAITWFGVIVIALVGVMIVAVWIALAGRLARRAAHPDDGAEDRGLEALRHEHLVVRSKGDQQAAVVTELAPDSAVPETDRSNPQNR
jgi:hypothetical protein